MTVKLKTKKVIFYYKCSRILKYDFKSEYSEEKPGKRLKWDCKPYCEKISFEQNRTTLGYFLQKYVLRNIDVKENEFYNLMRKKNNLYHQSHQST